MSVLDQSASAGAGVLDPIAATIKNPFSTAIKPGKERPVDFPQGFLVVEYINGQPQDGQGGRPYTIIQLAGNMMPMQPFSWAGEQRLTTVYYPGNPEPSVQILGDKEGPLVIHGRFKDKKLQDSALYGVSYQFAELFRALRKRGNLLKFGMHGVAGSWFRYGFLEKADFKMNKLSYIDYELHFLVVSDQQPKNNFFAAPDKTAPNSINRKMIDAASAFASTYSAVPTSMPLSIAGAINNIISGVAKNINLVTGFVDTVISTGKDIQASANRAIGLIRNARTQIVKYQFQLDGFVHSFSSLSNPAGSSAKFRNTYKNLAYINSTMAGIGGVSSVLAQLQKQLQQISQTTPLARYKAITGDTLQNISQKYYGTSDDWKLIYDHNQLQTTKLTPGQVLEIPRL